MTEDDKRAIVAGLKEFEDRMSAALRRVAASEGRLRLQRRHVLASAGDHRKYGVEIAADFRRLMARCKCAPRPDRRRAGTYLVGIRDTYGPIKIGRATEIVARVTQLQSASPVPLEILAIVHDMGAEPRLHRMFSERRLHGEWFAPHGELADWIKIHNRDGGCSGFLTVDDYEPW